MAPCVGANGSVSNPSEQPLGDLDLDVAERVESAPANLVFASLSGCLLVALVLVLALVGAVLALPTLREGNQRATEREAIRALRELEAAQTKFREDDLDGDGIRNFGSLGQLARAGLIGPDLASGVLRGFRLEVQPSQTEPEEAWIAVANRAETHTGRSFVLNHKGAIHYTYGELISPDLYRCTLPEGAHRMDKGEERRF